MDTTVRASRRTTSTRLWAYARDTLHETASCTLKCGRSSSCTVSQIQKINFGRGCLPNSENQFRPKMATFFLETRLRLKVATFFRKNCLRPRVPLFFRKANFGLGCRLFWTSPLFLAHLLFRTQKPTLFFFDAFLDAFRFQNSRRFLRIRRTENSCGVVRTLLVGVPFGQGKWSSVCQNCLLPGSARWVNVAVRFPVRPSHWSSCPLLCKIWCVGARALLHDSIGHVLCNVQARSGQHHRRIVREPVLEGRGCCVSFTTHFALDCVKTTVREIRKPMVFALLSLLESFRRIGPYCSAHEVHAHTDVHAETHLDVCLTPWANLELTNWCPWWSREGLPLVHITLPFVLLPSPWLAILNIRVEQETCFATMAAIKTIISKKLIHKKRAHRKRLSFLHTNQSSSPSPWNHRERNHHDSTNGDSWADPNQETEWDEWGVMAPSFIGEPPLGPLPNREKGTCTKQRGPVQCKLQKPTGQSGGAGSRQSRCRQRGCTGGRERRWHLRLVQWVEEKPTEQME